MRARYDFSDGPESLDQLSNEFKFSNGSFNGTALKSLSFHDDGVIINAPSESSFLREVLEDLFIWFSENNMGTVQSHDVNRFYRSAIVVKANKALISVPDSLQDAVSAVEASLGEHQGYSGRYTASSVSFSSNEQDSSPGPIRIERKVGTSDEHNIYFCEAPLCTSELIEVIAKIEASL